MPPRDLKRFALLCLISGAVVTVIGVLLNPVSPFFTWCVATLLAVLGALSALAYNRAVL